MSRLWSHFCLLSSMIHLDWFTSSGYSLTRWGLDQVRHNAHAHAKIHGLWWKLIMEMQCFWIAHVSFVALTATDPLKCKSTHVYLELSSLVSLTRLLLQLCTVELGPQHLHGLLFVFDLGALLLTLRHCACNSNFYLKPQNIYHICTQPELIEHIHHIKEVNK